jgi:hypothetical protein
MSIGAVGSALMQIQQIQTQQVRTHRDADGDNDGSRAGEVEAAESKAGNTGRIGSTIDEMA